MTTNGVTNRKSQKEKVDSVPLEKIPNFSDLKAQVDVLVQNSSLWDRYGVDWALVFIFTAVGGYGIWLMGAATWPKFLLGMFLYGWCYQHLGTKAGHISGHGGLCESRVWRRRLTTIFVEIIGSFSEELAHSAHIKEHHPYTNIIGIGDSSTWKVPFLPRYIYMFLAPTILPVITPLVSIAGLVEKDQAAKKIAIYIIRAGFGLTFVTYLVMKSTGYGITGALLVIWFSRAILSISYIHVNIFQHIGLPMYSKEKRPIRIYQMATGVLNLPSNFILDYAFGHSIISCHVEHHLFPYLSDNMCLKIKPIVSKFLKESSLPYNEATYTNRLLLFLKDYDRLMVNAPPITHFVGIQ